VFNSTYKQQAEVDARLSNGADLTVTESPGVRVGPQGTARLEKISGVRSVEPLQHRFAYVGSDLQDLYGVRPATIGAAGELQDGWFAGGSAKGLMGKLRAQPDSVLVSAETVKDFQLHPGDLLRLRLQNGQTKRFATVPLHYAGVAKEFPTAPTDSFLVANAGYVAKATGSDAIGSFLIQTDGTNPTTVAKRVGSVVGTSAKVTDIGSSRQVIGSGLTAVELAGLTRVELGFALVLAAAASGLSLGLGFHKRRRTFAIAGALGAEPRQLGGFVWSESLFVTGGGLALGTAIARGISHMLEKVLSGRLRPAAGRARRPVDLPRRRCRAHPRRRRCRGRDPASGLAPAGNGGATGPVAPRTSRRWVRYLLPTAALVVVLAGGALAALETDTVESFREGVWWRFRW
jgi:putative ABC transport system permease protein